MTKPAAAVNVGVDVGKFTLDGYLFERQRAFSYGNDAEGIEQLIRRLRRYGLERIVLEATVRLEQLLVRAVLAVGLPVKVVSPSKVHRYASAIGQQAKTDAIDAPLIAKFAALVKNVVRGPKDPEARNFKDFIVRRWQLTEKSCAMKSWGGKIACVVQSRYGAFSD